MIEFDGGCLCVQTTYVAKGQPKNPHLCSCTMCQKSSGSPTVAWVEFPRDGFSWSVENQLGFYQSSEKKQRCFCKHCGSFLGALNDGDKGIFVVIASLNNPNLIVPGRQHSYKEEAPAWWEVDIIEKQ